MPAGRPRLPDAVKKLRGTYTPARAAKPVKAKSYTEPTQPPGQPKRQQPVRPKAPKF